MVVNFIDPSFVKTSRIVYVLDQQKRIKGKTAEAVNSIEKSAYMAAYQAQVLEGDTA